MLQDRPTLKLREMPDGTIDVFQNVGRNAYVSVNMVDGRRAEAVVPNNVWTKFLLEPMEAL